MPFDVAHDIFIALSAYLLESFEKQFRVFLEKGTFRGYQRADVRTIMMLSSGTQSLEQGENEGILVVCYQRILIRLNTELRVSTTHDHRRFVEQQKEQMKRMIMEITVNAIKAEELVRKHDSTKLAREKGKSKIGEQEAKQHKEIESLDSEVS